MLISISAGNVMIAADHRDAEDRVRGHPLRGQHDQIAEPGTARSRLNANVIRDAEVRHDVAQKNCADAEMNSTTVAQSCPSGGVKM